MLDLVQHHLDLNGFTFQRIDGQSSLPKRRNAICRFNDDPKCTVMLASIASAGEGYVDCFKFSHLCHYLTNRHTLQSRSHGGKPCAPA